MSFAELLTRFTDAVAAGDAAAAAACFTEDGAYHDVFYGAFHGRDGIRTMIEERFHRDGADFRWDMRDVVESGDRGYARYVFSYRSKLAAAKGARAVFEGVVTARLKGGLIAEYGEVANAAVGLSMMGFEDARIAKFIAKQAAELRARDETARHLD